MSKKPTKPDAGARIAKWWFDDASPRNTEFYRMAKSDANLAACIRRAISAAVEKASNLAMLAERARIRNAVQRRFIRSIPHGVPFSVLEDVLSDISGPMSGAPDKGIGERLMKIHG